MLSSLCEQNSQKKTSQKKRLGLFAIALLTFPIVGCSTSSTTPSAAGPEDAATKGAPGTLLVEANGEDFVRQGFVDKDGWQISFDHVYVTLSDIAVAQKESTAGAEAKASEVIEQVDAEATTTVDLAAGDENAAPILVTQIDDAPSGRYNALSWRMVPSTSGDSAGYPLMMVGTATKADETVAFDIKLSEELLFDCGDFVGEERKGILTAGETAEVEATFHFDHIFGDAEAAADDEINTGALGFDVLAALAENGELSVTSADLEARLAPENYNNLKTILTSLGHVGEGHCEATLLEE